MGLLLATFADRLRQLRRDAGLSQGELAGDELSASYISLLESGKRTPSTDVVHLLAARLGCSSSQLSEGRPSDREQLIELELAYAKLAIEHGESIDARDRLRRLYEQDELTPPLKDEVGLLLATALERLGEHVTAIQVLLPLFERASTAQSAVPVIPVAQVLCRVYLDSGDLHRAAQVGETALAIARRRQLAQTNEYFRLAATTMAAYTESGDLAHARTWAQSLIAEAVAAGEVAGQAVLYWNSALVAEMEGRLDEAIMLCEQAMGRLSELDNLRDYARVRVATAEIMIKDAVPDARRADQLLDSSLPDLRDLGSRADLGGWNRTKAAVLLLMGDSPGAETHARQAVELLADAQPEVLVPAWLTLYDTFMAQGRTGKETVAYLDRACDALPNVKAGRAASFLWRDVADRLVERGDFDRGLPAYRHALSVGGVIDRSQAVRDAAARLSVEARALSADRG